MNLEGLADGATVSATIAVTPASALTLIGQGSGTIIALIDSASCTTPVLPPVTADDLIASCPSAEEIASLNADLNLTFQPDPTAALVCHAADGSADLTRVEERTYQTLRVMRQLSFDTPLPWTEKSLYDWLTSSVKGIATYFDLSSLPCCIPPNMIHVQSTNLATLTLSASELVLSQGLFTLTKDGTAMVFCIPVGLSIRRSVRWAPGPSNTICRSG
jgi:hypothetical protein